MKKVLLLAEGQTEETFAGEVLRPALRPRGVEIVPVVLKTKRLKQGGHFRGGITSYAQVRDDVRRLLHDTSAVRVTTMLDLYGLPDDFPGLDLRGTSPQAWAANVEQAWALDVDSPRFLPYLSVHEYEAFAFVAPGQSTTVFSPAQAAQLDAVRAHFNGAVENINDGPTTHPSARVQAVHPGYEKPVYGALIAIETGLAALEAACPRFAAWVSALRALGAT